MGRTKNHGFTIIEILATIGLIGFLSAATLSFSSFIRSEISKQETLSVRNSEQSMFFNILREPAYVGALAEYTENSDLKKCLDADGVTCETNVDYPLSAFDLENGKLLEVVDTVNAQNVKNEFSFRVHCAAKQETCDQAEYLNVRIRSSIKGDHGLQFTSDKTVVVQPKRSSVITMVPNTALEPGSPVNIIIFLDGSNSMAGIKDSFKATLSTLVEQVKTLDARVAVYPLHSHIYEAGGQPYRINAGVKEYLTPTEMTNAPGGFVRYTDYTWNLSTGYEFKPANPSDIPPIFSFQDDMSDLQRDATVLALHKRIDNIFNLMGPKGDRDAGLCGILRLLDQTSHGLSPFTMDSTTPTILMILTNEDDESVLIKPGGGFGVLPVPYSLEKAYICAKGVTVQWTKEKGKTWYYGDKYVYQVSGTATESIDGVPYTKPFTNAGASFIPYRSTMTEGADCLADAKGADYGQVKYSLSYWNVAKGDLNIASCKIALTKAVSIGVWEEYEHPCDLYNKNPSTFMPSMVPGTCFEKLVPSSQMGWAGTGAAPLDYYVPTDTEAHATGSLPTAVLNLLRKNFDLKNVFLSVVINPTTGVCSLTQGAHFGSQYEQLAAKPELKSQIVPICSNNYGERILDFTSKIGTLGMNDFTLPVGIGARVSGVDILRNSTTVAVTEGADYTRKDDLIIFTAGILKTTDIVRVYLK
jgi:prepilin-type N-terminal cleavage/methylation domain-containing protein